MLSLGAYIAFFLLASAAVAVITACIRQRDPKIIVSESSRFFLTIVIGIFVFCAITYALEWVFVRRFG